MADIDPRIKQFEKAAAELLAAAKRSDKRAANFEKQVEKGSAGRGDLDERVRKEVARDRIKGETIGESGTGRNSKRAVEEQASAQKKQGRETEKNTRLADQARRSEERLTRTRKASTKSILSQAEAEKRYGQFAGRRYAQTSGPGASVLTRSEARALAVRNQGEFAGGGGFDRRFPPPPPPPPPSGGGAGGGGFYGGGKGGRGPGFYGPEPDKYAKALGEEQRNLRRLDSSIARSTAEHQRLIQVQASGSNVLRRNGALTTEFIQAASRGEVTIRELGYQTASTIGKFGGWITAGAALYTALGAVQKLGAGALDAASGVNQLERVVNNVNGDDLTKGFSELSDYFQLPVGEVTEGVYEIGKVFHDQNDALEASKALLYSVKVGELDTATAGRYLIAITNAYNLSQQDLNATFDKFNQLQNNFGVAIAGTEAATARAAGTFVNAGGSLDYLISLIGTASRVTGAAPERIGTAIQRSASFIQKPKNQQTLRQFGINPKADIETIYQEAFQVAKGLSGRKRLDLASSIFGPQYGASIGTPLLRQYSVFKKIQDSVAHSKGSGARELATLKGSPEEQIKNIGIQLERLGIGFEESGLLDGVAALVLSLDDVLRLANSVVDAFNDLPGPLKTSLSYMFQLSLLARGLGRLNLGEPRPGKEAGPGRVFAEAALGGGGKRDARLIRKGLYAEKEALESERASSADRARDQSSRSLAAQEGQRREGARRASLLQASVKDDKAIADASTKQTIYAQEAAASKEAQVQATLDEETKARRLNEVNQRLEKGRGRFGSLNVGKTLSAAEERPGAFYPTTFDQPTTQRPGLFRRRGGVAEPQARPSSLIGPPTRLEAQEYEKMAQAEKEANATTKRLSKSKLAAQKLGGAANRLLGSFSNLIFAAFTIGIVAEILSGQADKLGDEIESISTPATNAKDRTKRAKDLLKGSQSGSNFNQRLTNLFTETTDVFGVDVPTLGFGENGVDKDINDAERIAAQTIKQELALQRKQRRRGKPVSYRFAADIEADIQALKGSNKPAGEVSKQLQIYREELTNSYEATQPVKSKSMKAALEKARQSIQDRRVESATPKGLQNALAGLDTKEIQERLEAEVTLAGFSGGITKNRLKRARQIYTAQAASIGTSQDPEDIQALASARDSYFEGLDSAIQDELDHALALSKDPATSRAAYAEAYRNYRQAFGGGDQQLSQERKRLKALQQRLRASETPEAAGGQFHGLGGTDTKGVKKLQTQIKAQKLAFDAVQAEVKAKRQHLRIQIQELREAQYEEGSGLRESYTNLKVSRTADPFQQVRIKIQAINTELGIAIKIFGRKSKEVLDLLTQRQELLAEQAQDQLNLIDAQGSLRSAGLSGEGNEGAKARSDLATLEQKLAFEQSHANRFDPAEIVQLQADIREARISYAEQVEQEAEELAEAAFDVKLARAEAGGNDVKAARVNVQKARFTFAHADTKVEKKQARADLIGKRASLRDARLQSAIEDVEFEADIGKLTLDEQISAYERLLNTQKLTRDARRDLRSKIHALKKESEDDSTFDLNVGNIKLPTIYEIRRAVKGGVNGGGMTVTQTNNYNIRSTDPKGAAQEINKHNGGANKAAMRSAGVR